jgi:4-amino-4-deoxy-L-arabinose transferase-like glycosyltransferase
LKGRHILSDRISFFIVVILLLIAAALRTWNLSTLPEGFHADEMTNIRIIETVRAGNIEIFYDIGGADTIRGREGLYHTVQAVTTGVIGTGSLTYRLVPMWLGMLTVAMTYAAARRLIGYFGGVCAAGLIAVSFWPVLLSRQITSSTVLPLLVATALVLLTQILPIYRRRWQRGNTIGTATVLGVVLGTSLYIHPAGLLVLIFSLGFIGYMLYSRRGVSLQVSRRRNSYLTLMMFIIVVFSVPYLISTFRNPDLSGIQRFAGEYTSTYTPQDTINSLSGLIFAGDENPTRNLPKRPLFDPFSAILLLGGLGWVIANRREARYTLLLVATLVISPTFLFSAHAPNFDNYAAMLPLLALFFAVGVNALHDNLPKLFKRLAEISLVALVIFGITLTSNDLSTWRNHPDVQIAHNSHLGRIAAYIDRTAHELPTVICGWRANQSPSSRTLTEAQHIALMINRDAGDNLRYADCRNGLVLTNGGALQQVIIPSTNTLNEAHPAIMRWLTLGESVTVPNLPPDSVRLLDVEQSLADWGGQLTTGETVSYAPEAGGNLDEEINTPISFGGNLTLLGYTVPQDVIYQPSQQFMLVSYWRIHGRVPPDLRLFTHILYDANTSPAANTDITYVNPRFLRDRDIVIQATSVQLPPSLPDGSYYVSIGAYQDTSEIRLDVLANGQPYGTRLFLDNIVVQTETP